MARKRQVVKLPDKVELDFSDIPVYDQGELGSATACAAVRVWNMR